MAIKASTPWRTIGDIDMQLWQRVIDNAGGPVGLVRPEAWAAARPHSALCLAMLRMESSYGSNFRANPATNHNPLNLKRPEGGGYMRYDTWKEGVSGWQVRITSPTHKDGIYARTVSIADLINVYAPPSENDTGGYVGTVVKLLNDWLPGWKPTETAVEPEGDDMAVTFGRVPRPEIVEAIVLKPVHYGSAYGYDYCPAPRTNVGVVHHETMGRGSGWWYQGFFSCTNPAGSKALQAYGRSTGERCANALVDFFIDKQGVIFMLNDPFGQRAGWANGGGVGQPGGLEGDGPAFYARFGANGINTKLVSIEYEKLTGENFTEAQVQAGGALAAWIHDRDGQSWERHPYTSKYGLVTSFLHYEFGTTDCGKGELDDISRVQAVTKGIMKRYQTGESGGPVVPDVPQLPDPEIPGGLTLEEAKRRFGTVRKVTLDGKVTTGGFDPKGIISLAWAHRAAEEQVWPKIETWYVLEDSGKPFDLVTFSNDWRMARVAERAGMQWVDLVPAVKDAA